MAIDKLPSLSLEPSHTAVILTFTYLCYLRCLELQIGKKPIIKSLFSGPEKWVTLGFLWTMTTMGSSTAFMGLAGLSLYFVKGRNSLIILPTLALLIFILPLL